MPGTGDSVSRRILVPNLGSTSLKYQLLGFPSEKTLARGKVERIAGPAEYRTALAEVLDRLLPGGIHAIGLKAIHGGPQFCGTFRVDKAVIAALREFEPAAPLHNPIYILAIETLRALAPDIPLVAVFETGFHRTMPEAAACYGVPRVWREQFGIRRYGFHGASHRYVSERVPAILGRGAGGLRLVSCHLGGSSSICAIQNGVSVDTTMGFSPQSGLENATRHGDLDPFAVLFLMDRLGYSTSRMRQELLLHGGLAGLSGIPGGDVRDLEAVGSPGARLALEVFAYQVRKTIGAYAAAMGGLDALAFTGGIGENSASLREACCRGLEFLGIRLDRERNRSLSGDRVVSPEGASVPVLALATNEELIVARETAALLW
ncbi:MAG: acetate/propionate family kinase [Acidobacteria bacterium]|nr:acetate/propionate family kinase [Acidobacteriota bacterium]